MLSDRGAIVLRISTNDFDRPHHDVVLLERSYFKRKMKGDDPVEKDASQIAEKWHEMITALIRTHDAAENSRNGTGSAAGSSKPNCAAGK